VIQFNQPFDRYDDEIFEHTMKTFPELAENDHAKLIVIDEEWMKSKDGKDRWRDFIMAYVCRAIGEPISCSCYRYEKKVKDYNFGSLIRTDARDEYGERNTIFGTSAITK
jgi:hypothetical protein